MPVQIPMITLPNGKNVPAMGQGTWHMGEDPETEADEIRALQKGMDLGMTLIDTAEMYASGGAEEIVREATIGRRNEVFIVSKILPSNASRIGTIAACEASLGRLGTDHIDLYLLHWPGRHPLRDTIESFERLKEQGKIGAWGVSNFDQTEMQALAAAHQGSNCTTNEVLYNLHERGIEFDLMPWMAQHSMPVMAYCPLDEGRLVHHPELQRLASAMEITAAQLALAFLIAQPNVIAIPKTASLDRLAENHAAASIVIPDQILAELDQLFPPPGGPVPLAIV